MAAAKLSNWKLRPTPAHPLAQLRCSASRSRDRSQRKNSASRCPLFTPWRSLCGHRPARGLALREGRCQSRALPTTSCPLGIAIKAIRTAPFRIASRIPIAAVAVLKADLRFPISRKRLARSQRSVAPLQTVSPLNACARFDANRTRKRLVKEPVRSISSVAPASVAEVDGYLMRIDVL